MYKKIIGIISVVMLSLLMYGCQGNRLDGIEGSWLLNDGSLMVISDNAFYWYQSSDTMSTNYFYGKDVRLLDGDDALDAIQVPEENREALKETHTYYMSVTYSQLNFNGQDASSQLDGKLSEFAFQIDAKDHLAVVNLLTNEQYTAQRVSGGKLE